MCTGRKCGAIGKNIVYSVLCTVCREEYCVQCTVCTVPKCVLEGRAKLYGRVSCTVYSVW